MFKSKSILSARNEDEKLQESNDNHINSSFNLENWERQKTVRSKLRLYSKNHHYFQNAKNSENEDQFQNQNQNLQVQEPASNINNNDSAEVKPKVKNSFSQKQRTSRNVRDDSKNQQNHQQSSNNMPPLNYLKSSTNYASRSSYRRSKDIDQNEQQIKNSVPKLIQAPKLQLDHPPPNFIQKDLEDKIEDEVEIDDDAIVINTKFSLAMIDKPLNLKKRTNLQITSSNQINSVHQRNDPGSLARNEQQKSKERFKTIMKYDWQRQFDQLSDNLKIVRKKQRIVKDLMSDDHRRPHNQKLVRFQLPAIKE